MASKEIDVLSWDEAQKLLSSAKKSLNLELLETFNEISHLLKQKNNDYVYHLRLEFGDKIIDKGKMSLEELNVKLSSFKKTKEDFKNDIQYSDDPLGIVLNNHVEVFTDNKSHAGGNHWLYTLPLNTLESGDLFGVFGTLDYFSGIKNYTTSREWYARAGSISYSIAFPFHNSFETEFLECLAKYGHLSGKDEKQEETPGDNKVEFIKDFIEDWFVDIAYIPKHFFEEIPYELKRKICNILYDIGWKQSAPLRNTMFEDTTIYNLISNSRSTKFKHDKNFLNILYGYLFDAYNGNALVMKPLIDKEHVIHRAIKGFKRKNKNYFSINKAKEPLPFIFGRLKDDIDWGIVSIYHLPIIYNYEIQSLNILLKDLYSINNKIDGITNINNNYKLPKLEGYGNTGGKGTVKVQKTAEIRNLMSETFKIKCDKINLNSKEFSNLLLIKKENK
jgi:hypothetical protein